MTQSLSPHTPGALRNTIQHEEPDRRAAELLKKLPDPSNAVRTLALQELLREPERIKDFIFELWGLARQSQQPVRDLATRAIAQHAIKDPEVFNQAIERLHSQDTEAQVAAADVLSRIGDRIDRPIAKKMRELLESELLSPSERQRMEDVVNSLSLLSVVWRGSKIESFTDAPPGAKICGRAMDYALYFRATKGPAYEQGLLLWVMCPTSGLDREGRMEHCEGAVGEVLHSVNDERIEYIGRGRVGFVINEQYFSRGCTWKDLTFETIKLNRASTAAFGVELAPEEIAQKLVQIGTFRENSLEFSTRAGPASNSVPVNISHLLTYGRQGL